MVISIFLRVLGDFLFDFNVQVCMRKNAKTTYQKVELRHLIKSDEISTKNLSKYISELRSRSRPEPAFFGRSRSRKNYEISAPAPTPGEL